MDGEIIISIPARALETRRDGHLMIFRHTDTLYSVTYRDKSEVVQVDLDNIAIDIKQQLVRFIDPYLLVSHTKASPLLVSDLDSEGDAESPLDPPSGLHKVHQSDSGSGSTSGSVSSPSSDKSGSLASSYPTHPSFSLTASDPSAQMKFVKPVSSSFFSSYSFLILDRRHLHMFNEAYNESNKVTNLVLELHAKFRDVYYSGVTKSVKKRHLGGGPLSPLSSPLLGGLSKLQEESFNGLMENLQELASAPHLRKIEEVVSSLALSNARKAKSSSTAGSGPPVWRRLKKKVSCFYCEVSSTTCETSLNFYTHPYVPLDFEQQPVFFCGSCLENWWKYRRSMEANKQLLLPGEVNEEICAICSDSPEEIVLCSSCPRSFCHICLKKQLGQDSRRLDKILSSDDAWPCMACCNKVEERPLLSRASWKLWQREKDKTEERPVVPKTQKRAVPEVEESQEPAALRVGHIASSHTVIPKATQEKKKASPSPSSSTTTALPPSKRSRSDSSSSSVSVSSPIKDSKPGLAPASLPVEPPTLLVTHDEVYYFAQYLIYLESRQKLLRKSPTSAPTEDTCFLCKDGGDLVECDWRRVFNRDGVCTLAFSAKNNNFVSQNPHFTKKGRGELVAPPYSSLLSIRRARTKGCPCTKVLHTYCLRDLMKLSYSTRQSFEAEKVQYLRDQEEFPVAGRGSTARGSSSVDASNPIRDYSSDLAPLKLLRENQYEDADEDDVWCCPRHFCRKCGRAGLSFSCALCPVSYCETCCISTYDPVIYTDLSIVDDTKKSSCITTGCCETCLVIVRRGVARGLIEEKKLTIFPLTPEGNFSLSLKSFLSSEEVSAFLVRCKLLSEKEAKTPESLSLGLEKLFQLRYKSHLARK